jgi:hypothetical protein
VIKPPDTTVVEVVVVGEVVVVESDVESVARLSGAVATVVGGTAFFDSPDGAEVSKTFTKPTAITTATSAPIKAYFGHEIFFIKFSP